MQQECTPKEHTVPDGSVTIFMGFGLNEQKKYNFQQYILVREDFKKYLIF